MYFVNKISQLACASRTWRVSILERFQDRYTLSALLRGRRSLGSRRLECIPFGYGNPETAIAAKLEDANLIPERVGAADGRAKMKRDQP